VKQFNKKKSLDRRKPARRSEHTPRRMRKEGDSAFYAAGRNSVTEALRAGQVKHIYVEEGGDSRLQGILKEAETRGIPVTYTDRKALDDLVPGVRHQGLAALLKPFVYSDLDDVLKKQEGKDPILVLLDGVEDVRNLGAIVRTAECAGAAGVLLPQHKSAPVTPAAMKTAAGAFATMPVCRIGNIRQTLENLKKQGFWVVGADMDGESLYTEANLKGPLVIVMGAEGKGVSRLTREMCDFCVRIPMKGKISSLNVSVAAALLLYEAVRQRG
jgi:23S rRNA (guanosine2251-2'-O)-methyltransferase